MESLWYTPKINEREKAIDKHERNAGRKGARAETRIDSLKDPV